MSTITVARHYEVAAQWARLEDFLQEERQLRKLLEKHENAFNPYYEIFTGLRRIYKQEWNYPPLARRLLTAKYAWAIPNDEALKVIGKYAPIVEVGAGTGYWAWLLQKLGHDVLAIDAVPTGHKSRANAYGHIKSFTKVSCGYPSSLRYPRYRNRTLMLCWPCYATSMARDCLRHYDGDTVVYIGEGQGGCTADDAFFDALNTHWEVVESCQLPQWDDLHDGLIVLRRRC